MNKTETLLVDFVIPKLILLLLVVYFVLSLSYIAPKAQFGGEPLDTENSETAIRDTFDHEEIAVSTTAVGFLASKINPTVADKPASSTRAAKAHCFVGTDAIRYLTSGTNPTSTLGILVAVNTSFTIFGYDDISSFRAIRVTADSALDCQYSRRP